MYNNEQEYNDAMAAQAYSEAEQNQVEKQAMAEIEEQEIPEDHCPECGCGFVAKYDDGTRICLYCPNRWTV